MPDTPATPRGGSERTKKIDRILAANANLLPTEDVVDLIRELSAALDYVEAKVEGGEALTRYYLTDEQITEHVDEIVRRVNASRQAGGEAEHVCDHRCRGENGHHSWPSPAPADAGGVPDDYYPPGWSDAELNRDEEDVCWRTALRLAHQRAADAERERDEARAKAASMETWGSIHDKAGTVLGAKCRELEADRDRWRTIAVRAEEERDHAKRDAEAKVSEKLMRLDTIQAEYVALRSRLVEPTEEMVTRCASASLSHPDAVRTILRTAATWGGGA